MSLYGMMRTGVSGMAAQSARLGTVADNIANVSTTALQARLHGVFHLGLDAGVGAYLPGSVETHTRYAISSQGR